MLKKLFQVSLLSLSLMFLAGSGYTAPPYDTVSIKGEFTKAENDLMYSRLRPGMQRAKRYAEQNGAYFTHINSNKYHISCAVLESATPNTQLVQADIDTLTNLAAGLIKQDGNAHGYVGKMYGLYAFVHGYDAQGKELHRHYKNPAALRKILNGGTDKVFGKAGSKITHVHFVLRFGTNPTDGADGQPGELQKEMTIFMDTIDLLKDTIGLKDVYDRRDNFTGHVTAGVLKSFQGKADATKPALDKAMVVQAYELAYSSFNNWKSHQDKTRYTSFTLKDFHLNGEKIGGNPRFEKIGDL